MRTVTRCKETSTVRRRVGVMQKSAGNSAIEAVELESLHGLDHIRCLY